MEIIDQSANNAYNGIDLIPFSNPMFFVETLIAYPGVYLFL